MNNSCFFLYENNISDGSLLEKLDLSHKDLFGPVEYIHRVGIRKLKEFCEMFFIRSKYKTRDTEKYITEYANLSNILQIFKPSHCRVYVTLKRISDQVLNPFGKKQRAHDNLQSAPSEMEFNDYHMVINMKRILSEKSGMEHF